VLSTLSSFVICVVIAIREYKHINVKMIIPIIVGNALAITLVMLFWSGDSVNIMKKILGGFLIILSLYFIFLKNNIRIKSTIKGGLLSGSLGGVLNSLFSMGAPPVVVYLIAASKNIKEYHASLQAYFCFSCIYVTISRYMRGMITEDVWPLFFAGLPFIAIGSWIGLKLFGKLNDEKLRFIVYIFMALSGTVMILN
jgi:uncharacterized membrane protein YfcA